MNILVVDQFSDPGGAQLCLLDLLPGFLARGWRPRVMLPGNGGVARQAAELGIPVDSLPLGRYGNGEKTASDALRFGADMVRIRAEVRRLVRRQAVDAIYCNGPRPLPALAGTGLPTVFHSHSILNKRYARALAGWALRRTGATVVAVSRFVAESWAGIRPVHVVYTGVSDQRPAADARPHGAPVRIGIIGRIAPEKGHTDFLEAARLIHTAGRNVRFVIYGAALFSDPAYEARVRPLAGGLPVEFRGWTDDMAAAFRELDILAIPSRSNEAAPRVALEALSAGVPVVAYRSGGIPELIADGRSGLLTSAHAPEALAAALLRLIDDPELRARLGAGGRCEWERRFTLERYRREVCDLVEAAARAHSTNGMR